MSSYPSYGGNGSLVWESGGRPATYTYTPSHLLAQATLRAGPVYSDQYDGGYQRIAKAQGGLRTMYYLHRVGRLRSEFEQENERFRWMGDNVCLGGRL